MISAPLRPTHCPMCQGIHVTPPTRLKQQSTDLTLEAVFQGPDRSWASAGTVGVEIGRGSVCLDCGFVLLFLSSERLDELRRQAGSLAPL